MKTNCPRLISVVASVAMLASCPLAWAQAPVPPELAHGSKVDRKQTYNLGATGLRGWIHTQPLSHFDGLQGRTTVASRQLLVTHAERTKRFQCSMEC